MDNLFSGEDEKSFYVWVRPKDIYANYNANMVGSFVSVANADDNLMFLPNKNFSGYISPFQGNLLRSYQAEYDLEVIRKESYSSHPSRLVATFLFENQTEALKYKETHSLHVGDRELKKGRTVGPYSFSRNDLAWIDFLRSQMILEPEIKNRIIRNYWEGISAQDFKLNLIDHSVYAIAESVFEILFIGRINFDR